VQSFGAGCPEPATQTPGASPLGVVSSNGLELVLGTL